MATITIMLPVVVAAQFLQGVRASDSIPDEAKGSRSGVVCRRLKMEEGMP